MGISFTFEPLEAIPALSWCAEVRRNSASVNVWHGTAVETPSPDFFVEGAWAGDYADAHPDERFLAGSAGRIQNDEISFLAPSHIFERLVAYCDGERWLVSNSLVFPLVIAGDHLDARWPFHQNYIYSILRGTEQAMKTLPTSGGNRLHLFYRENLSISRTGGIAVRPKAPGPGFNSYETYVEHLTSVTGRLFHNAGDSLRSIQYRPISTISAGFDSAASAALAKDLGCDEALTMRRFDARGERRDDGRAIASALEVSLIEADRMAYLDSEKQLPEAEFLACGFAGEDTAMSAWEPWLQGRLMVTGAFGDRLWGSGGRNVNTRYSRGSAATSSLFEFRSRVGFIHFPLPFLGAEHASEILRIARSREMESWSTGGSYDRPIPARILQERGVERNLFGKKKLGYITKFSLNPADAIDGSLHSALSTETYDAFTEYLAQNSPLIHHTWCEVRARPLRRLYKTLHKQSTPILSALTKTILGHKPEHCLNARYGADALLPLWGMEVLRNRYRAAVG